MRGLLIAVGMMMLGLAGCSSMSTSGPTYQIDTDKVALINATARQRGVEVVWVHPPQKKVDATSKNPGNLADK